MALRDWLESSGRSVVQLAADIGVGRAAAYRYLDGSRMPRPVVARRIVEVTGGAVSHADLAAGFTGGRA